MSTEKMRHKRSVWSHHGNRTHRHEICRSRNRADQQTRADRRSKEPMYETPEELWEAERRKR